ncbi:S53 family peptidase [Gloeobacter kilaueensis]|uniref:Peptidase S53 propeptide n=1 Tax=Gloeobacter kilaueensis (strain ATCC BAA-2537 / CCAP 1431/1 / ULC 316 / JS1) TaxID=1183438 RepID=U5QIF1_GLOK1|nr:S53 family peptidase [Gloeobacter kilaueensis]AGY57430.1 peptidase S53 propeptide [Gloeobacter kilaueensis JS1]
MESHFEKVPLPRSERMPIAGARALGAVDPGERVEVSIYLKPRSTVPTGGALSREQYVASQAAHPDDLARVEAFAHEHDLSVVEVDAARRLVVLAGTAAAMAAAFDVQLDRFEHSGVTYRGRSGPVFVPAKLASIIQGVFGLDDRPQAQPRLRRSQPLQVTASYTPTELARLYNFPTGGNGQGQSIAMIELGGGYRSRDLRAYFQQLGIPKPKVVGVSVDGGHNAPVGSPDSADGEVLLDIEVAGAVAPGARIVVYFAPNTDRGFLDAVTAAIHDTRHAPSVLSISWGAPESAWTLQAMQAMDQAFQAAAALGVTVFCAAGDRGSSDGVEDGLAHVDFPASSPFAVACGGTRLESQNGTLLKEIVWNDGEGGATGGGVSDVFEIPVWQSQTGILPASINPDHHIGRGLPDIAGDADPATGYQIRVDGQMLVFGGTSAVAPLWAGLIALINQQLGTPVGYLNPLLYQQLSQQLRSITLGDNGGYQAGPGWDACTGLGAPDGSALLSALQNRQPAEAIQAARTETAEAR